MLQSLPPEVVSVFREFRTCEFTTLTKAGSPATWPVSTRYLPDQGRFLLTSSIGLPQKVYNVRRSPRVSLLFSNPTGSGLANPPAVLVQGDAAAGDEVAVSVDAVPGLREYWRETIFRRQPASYQISANPLMRKMMDWYYMRILIHVTPKRVFWWPDGDFNRPALCLEASHVA